MMSVQYKKVCKLWLKWMLDEQDCEKALQEIQEYSIPDALIVKLFQDLLVCLESSSNSQKTIVSALHHLMSLSGSSDKIRLVHSVISFIYKHRTNTKLCLELVTLGEITGNVDELTLEKYRSLFSSSVYVLLVEKCTNPEQFAVILKNNAYFVRTAMKNNSKSWLKEALKMMTDRNMSNLLSIQPQETFQKYLQQTLIKPCRDSEALDGNSNFTEYLSLLNALMEINKSRKFLTAELHQLNEIYEQHKWFTSIPRDSRSAVQIFVSFLCATDIDIAEEQLTTLRNVFKLNKTTKDKDTLNEATIFITKHLPTKVQSLTISLTFALTYINVMHQILHVVRRLDQDLKLCNECTSTKRHLSIDVLKSIFDVLRPLIASETDITSIATSSFNNIKYLIDVIKELKCTKKVQLLNLICVNTYNLIIAIKGKEQILMNYGLIENLFKILIQNCDYEKNGITLLKIVKLVEFIYSHLEADDRLNGECFVMLYYLQESSNADDKTQLINCIARARPSFKLSRHYEQYKTLTEFICNNQFKGLNVDKAIENLNEIDLVLAEIKTIDRFENKYDDVLSLMKRLQNLTQDPLVLGEALYSIHNSCYRSLDPKLIDFINVSLNKMLPDLDEGDEENVKFFTILGFVNYYYYLMDFEKTKQEYKEKELEAKINSLTRPSICVGTIEKETETVNFLNNALKHFSDMLNHFYQANNGEITGLPSVRRVMKMIETIGQQMLLRNIKSKAVEAFIVLFGLCKLRNDSLGLVTVATFFLDHHELLAKQMFQLSQCFSTPSIEELILSANEKIKNYLIKFESLDVNTQSYVISYLLSLTRYYAKTGELRLTADTLIQVSEIMESWQTNERTGYKIILEAKRYSCYADIIVNNPSVLDMNAISFLTFAAQELRDFKYVSSDFSSQIQIIYGAIALQIVNYNISTCADFDRLCGILSIWKLMSIKSGYMMKVVEISIFSIFRSLQNQNAQKSKSELLELNQILGIKEEMLVCIQSPHLQKTPEIATLDWSTQDLEMSVRKMVVKEDPIKYEMIQEIGPDKSKTDVEKLSKYMHPLKCKCQCCKYPQLKFQLFQISCLYARLLFLNNKFDTNNEFNEVAFKHWDMTIQKKFLNNSLHLPTNFQASKREFVLFSVSWLMQIYDVCLKLQNYKRCEEICLLAADICLKFQPSNYSMQQNIFVRLQTVKCIKDYERIEKQKEVDLAEFDENFQFKVFKMQLVEKNSCVKSKTVPTISSLLPKPVADRTTKPSIATPKIGPLAASRQAAKTSSRIPIESSSEKSTLSTFSTGIRSRSTKKNIQSAAQSLIYISSDSDSEASSSTCKNVIRQNTQTERKTRNKTAPKK